MHADAPSINIDEIVQTEPLRPESSLVNLMRLCVVAGVVVFVIAAFKYPPELLWGAYYTSAVFFMGLACGGVMISVILQIVRATWAQPIRRFAEANAAYLPWAFVFWLCTWFGKEHLFPWGREPMPGREQWMQPWFVYSRFTILFLFLFYLMMRFVRMSVRGDVGMIRERAKDKTPWLDYEYDHLLRGWKGTSEEVPELQNKLSWNAPLIVIIYAVVYSLFAFEMVMGMDKIWYSNMFGGFLFVGNIYIGWAVTALFVIYFSRKSPVYARNVSTNELWDLGKLTFGFCMLWGYLFISQFLPQWYGNLPEETQWLILRTRELPWKPVSYIALSMCFVIPFILLVSEDLKKTPSAYAVTCFIILIGVWVEKYVIIMPQLSPTAVPFGVVEVGLFFGFLGVYVLSILGFLSKYPFIPVSHPQSVGKIDW